MAQRKELNCPNCGAPIAADKCPYCGTVFWDFASIDMKALNYIKIKYNGKVYACRAYLTEQTVKTEPDYELSTTQDGRPYMVSVMPNVTMQLTFQVVPDDENILYRVVEV